MFLIALRKVLILKTHYILLRKTDFFSKLLKRWFKEQTITKHIYLFLVSWNLIKYAAFFGAVYFAVQITMKYLSDFEILLLFFHLAFLSALFEGSGYVKNVLEPMDEPLLSTSPLSNREMYLFNWISHSVFNFLPNYLYISIAALVLTISLPSVTALYGAAFAILTIMMLSVIFSVSVFLCMLSVNRIRNGYGWGTFIVSLTIGLLTFIISYVLSRSLLAWIAGKPDLFNGNSWGNLVQEFFISARHVLNADINSITISYYLAAISGETASFERFVILFLALAVSVILFAVAFAKAGHWYRSLWKIKQKEKNDWIDLIRLIFTKLSNNIFFRTQVLHLFRDRIQLSHHYTYFFLHYSNYMFLGIAFGAMNILDHHHAMLRFIFIFIIYNAISRDAFESGTRLFPGILRFDGDGRAIGLYRISGVSPLNVYDAKIRLQRLLGTAEFIIMFAGISFLLKLSPTEYIFVAALCLYNAVCIPHLKLLPSYASPHFDKQHYSEAEDFQEHEIWEDSVESRLSQFLFIVVVAPLSIMILFEFNIQTIYTAGSAIIAVLTLVILAVIRRFKNKFTQRMNRMDL